MPLFSALSVSLMTGNFIHGFNLTWHWAEYSQAINQYHTEIIRSFEYGAISTAAALVITYPMAYWIAFHGGRHKSTYLFLILLMSGCVEVAFETSWA